MCENSENLIELVQEKFNLGNELLKKIENLNQINGMAKIRRKICSEITFLEKVNIAVFSYSHVSYLFFFFFR